MNKQNIQTKTAQIKRPRYTNLHQIVEKVKIRAVRAKKILAWKLSKESRLNNKILWYFKKEI